ncbi:hypothetical protein [Lysinibacillus capsici]|uniref:hypothetical protein n=1 Tax=Lysinibacillus capsici TaxID=2115968 RepID=UPI00289BA62E|nr:hypothetical protein [Lysinibacillus capsici]
MNEFNIEHNFTQKVIKDYVDNGYRIYIGQGHYPDEFPIQIRSFMPDIVAISDDEKIIIEIVRNLNPNKLRQIQNFIEAIDGTGWQVKVINISDDDIINSSGQ